MNKSSGLPREGNISRRQLLQWAGLASVAGLLPSGCSSETSDVSSLPSFDQPIARFPEKVPMHLINDRAPQLETPREYFAEDLTPNEAFFVRWHLQPIPTKVDLQTWRLKIGGHIDKPLALSMDELRKMEPTEFVAVCQCSGNSRKFFNPPVPGGQWADGAMGNARWKGVSVRDILKWAGVKAGAVDTTFNGLDTGPLPATPDFIKSLAIDHAMQPDVILAYEMNGKPLPLLNGFPIRLVVPGWYATYWVKSIWEINVLPEKFTGYWMAKAYHIPDNADGSEKPDELAKQKVPISLLNVRSLWVNPNPEADVNRVLTGQPVPLEGIAFDAGAGIKQVEFSVDGGKTWKGTSLEADLGRYSFRRWRANWTPTQRGSYRLLVRAINNQGETQPMKSKWNTGGYMRNVIEEVTVEAS